MARPRTPTAILEARGAFKNHPNRKRRNEPQTGMGIGPAPDDMTDAEKAVWDEIVAETAPGLMQSSDRRSLEQLVALVAQFREDRAAFPVTKHSVLLTLWARFGLTPSDRAKIVLSNGEEQSERPKVGLASFV
jgi:hypothetical protein